MDAYADACVIAALEKLEHIEWLAYAVERHTLTPRAKLARIRLLRREARIVLKKMRRKLREQR